MARTLVVLTFAAVATAFHTPVRRASVAPLRSSHLGSLERAPSMKLGAPRTASVGRRPRRVAWSGSMYPLASEKVRRSVFVTKVLGSFTQSAIRIFVQK